VTNTGNNFAFRGVSVARHVSDGDAAEDGNGAEVSEPTSRKGQTGWNHNVPSRESDFWATKDEGSGTDSPSNESEEQWRTGWLHNTSKASTASTAKSKNGDSKDKDEKKGGLYQARRLLQLEKIKQRRNHRILAPPTFHACGGNRRVVVTEHAIQVPLDHVRLSHHPLDASDYDDLVKDTIDVYFTIVDLVETDEQVAFYASLTHSTDLTKADTSHRRKRDAQNLAAKYRNFIAMEDADACCLYLQGGPGFGAPTPIVDVGIGEDSSWVGAAIGTYKRIVLMDQRGTGRSTPITKQTLQKKFPNLFALDAAHAASQSSYTNDYSTPEDVHSEIQAFSELHHPEEGTLLKESLSAATDYLSHFRADNIVTDAEAIREALLPVPEDDDEPTPKPWGAALGQSFGGFCIMTYLSQTIHPPKICLLTGGIAPMLTPIDTVYTRLAHRVTTRNLLYYDQYPGDIPVVKRIVDRLERDSPSLPSGGVLTPRRFLQLGISLGGSPSSFASLHSLLNSAFIEDGDEDLSRAFLKGIDKIQPFDDCPIYFLMHESIYADGGKEGKGRRQASATQWSADRVYGISNGGEFDYRATSTSTSDPTIMFGEVVFPWMADGDYAELSGLGMHSLAHTLATKTDWDDLYDAERMRSVLAKDGTGITRAAAALYYDDMYVDFDSAMEVLGRGGPLEDCRVWVTNDYQHSGLRDDGAVIFKKLLGMAKGTVGTPS